MPQPPRTHLRSGVDCIALPGGQEDPYLDTGGCPVNGIDKSGLFDLAGVLAATGAVTAVAVSGTWREARSGRGGRVGGAVGESVTGGSDAWCCARCHACQMGFPGPCDMRGHSDGEPPLGPLCTDSLGTARHLTRLAAADRSGDAGDQKRETVQLTRLSSRPDSGSSTPCGQVCSCSPTARWAASSGGRPSVASFRPSLQSRLPPVRCVAHVRFT